MSHPSTKNKGFTLVEMIIVIFILTLIGLAVINFQADIFSLNKTSNENLLSQESARRALKNMSAEIRTMSPSNTGAYPILQVSTSSLTFYTNVDDDSPIERVRYFLSDGTLKRGLIEPTGTPLTYNSANETFINLAQNIISTTTPIFTFYDENYDGLSAPLDQPVNVSTVRLVKINIFIDKDPAKAPTPLNMTTQVSIRNLKNNQ